LTRVQAFRLKSAIRSCVTEILMRRALIGIMLLVSALTLSAAQPDAKDKDKDKAKAPLRVGGNLPGAFHPYNLGGKFDGRYHCPISEQDLDPTVLLFTRDIVPTPALEQLIVDLGVAARKNRDLRLTVVVVFLPKLDESRGDAKKDKEVVKGLEPDPTLEKQNTVEDNRLDTAGQLRDWLAGVTTQIMKKAPDPPAKEDGGVKKFAGPETLVVTVADPSDVAHYKLADSDKLVVVLYSKLEVKGLIVLETLKEDDIKGIMDEVRDKLGAVRK
jgi:hypothetical protein